MSHVGSDGAPARLLVRWLGRVPYDEAQALQAKLVSARRLNEVGDTLLLLEHPPVITLGRGASPAHVVATRDELARRGIETFEVGRGGDVTYHGPGQLVGYPIIALAAQRRDAHRYLRDLEEALIGTCAAFGVRGERVPGLTGVWVGGNKVAAIGVRLSSGWITSHGFALNVDTDLEGFETIVPCGIGNRGVTSLGRILGEAPGLREVAAVAAEQLATIFGLGPTLPHSPAEQLAPAHPGALSWTLEGTGDRG